MRSDRPPYPIVAIEHLELRFAPRRWDFAEERRADIDAHFAALQRERPSLWNGQVLMLSDYEVVGTTLRGSCLQTDFASFMAWRDWGYPDPTMRNCFAHAALTAADGAFLLGEMGPHTANPGSIYFPGGTPDPSDLNDGRVDLEANLRRELTEETGLTAADVQLEPGWVAVLAGQRVALNKILHSAEPAAALRARIMRHIASDRHPELADIHILRGVADLDDRIPDFVQAFLMRAWEEGSEVSRCSRPTS
jgi:8-oxo-dGTP pyrophosphatase MutT (NUDIX family)